MFSCLLVPKKCFELAGILRGARSATELPGVKSGGGSGGALGIGVLLFLGLLVRRGGGGGESESLLDEYCGAPKKISLNMFYYWYYSNVNMIVIKRLWC